MWRGKSISAPCGLISSIILCCLVTCTAEVPTNRSDDDGMTTTANNFMPSSEEAETENKTSPGFLVKASGFLPFKIGLALQTYWMAVIVPVGVTGNTLTLAVLLQKRNRRVSCCIYMAALALSDLMLMGLALYYWLITDVLPHGWSLWECKLLVWLFHTLTNNGTWIVVAMTVDRCIAVTKPLLTLTWCRPIRAYVTSVVVAAASILYCVPHILYTSVLETKTSCAGFTSGDGPFGLVYSWASLGISCLVPFSIILVLNLKIALVIMRRGKLQMHSSNHPDLACSTENGLSTIGTSTSSTSFSTLTQGANEGEHADDVSSTAIDRSNPTKISYSEPLPKMATNAVSVKLDSHEHQLIVNLFLVTFALLLLTMPQYVRYTVYEFLPFRDDPASFADYILAFHLTQKLYYTNGAINFFLYCLSGSRFRTDLKRTLTCCCAKD